MKKINSKYLGIEFDVNTDSSGCPTDASLMDVLYHQTPIDRRPTVDWNMIPANYPACECIIIDMLGNRVTGYGSVMDVADKKQDVIYLARMKAFREAMMLFYDFDIEVQTTIESQEPKQEPTINEDAAVNGGETFVGEVADDAGGIQMVEHNEAAETVPAPSNNTPTAKDPGAVVIQFGKFANNPKTVAEVYEDEVVKTNKNARNWYYYMCKTMTSEKYQDVIAAMKAYRSAREA